MRQRPPLMTQSCRSHLHDSSTTIAGLKFSGGYLHSALHPRWVFHEANVDGGSGEQAAREDSDEFGNPAHQFLPDRSFIFWLPQGVFLTSSGFDDFARSPSGKPEEMNPQVGSNRLRDEQSIRCEDKDDSPWAGRLRTHVIGTGNKKMVIQAE